MALRVLSVAFPLARVDGSTAGGAEQVLAMLDRALAREGHRSVLIAAAGSRARGELVALPAVPATIDHGAADRARASCAAAIRETLRREPFDLVHLHGLDGAEYLELLQGVPTLWTLHLPPSFYPAEALVSPPASVTLCCVSESQRRTLPPTRAHVEVIPNGVDLAAWRPGGARRRFALWMGRVCGEKAPHLAIDAVRRAGVPLVLVGETHPYAAHRAYLEAELRPRLCSGVRWIGARDGSARRRLLAAARCLLLPSLVAETSSLAAMEALACDTPVVAFRSGALPEIVEHERTGFVVDDADGMAAAIERAREIPPGRCRATACARFDAREMCARYQALYARCAQSRPPALRPAAALPLLDGPRSDPCA